MSQTSDLEVLRSGLEAALVVLDGSNSIVLEANDLAEKIESQRRELEKALATLRQAIVVCSRDHGALCVGVRVVWWCIEACAVAAGRLIWYYRDADETKLDKAMQLVEDCSAHDSSMEVVCARKLKNDLLPELATHVDTVRRIVAEWRSDERSSHENSLHWLQKSLDRLESAIAMRVIQEQRAVYLVDNDVNHAAAMLNLENVCVVPSSEEAVLLDDGGDLAQELQAAIDNLHNKFVLSAALCAFCLLVLNTIARNDVRPHISAHSPTDIKRRRCTSRSSFRSLLIKLLIIAQALSCRNAL